MVDRHCYGDNIVLVIGAWVFDIVWNFSTISVKADSFNLSLGIFPACPGYDVILVYFQISR